MTTIQTIIIVILLIVIASFIFIILKNKFINEYINQRLIRAQPYLLIAFLFVLLFSVIYSSIYYSKYFLPEPASDHGKEILPLIRTTFIITGITFLITQILLFYFPFKYRTKASQRAHYFSKHMKLELTWTIIPMFAFIVLFVWGQILWKKIHEDPKDEAVEVEIMGQQFNWWIRYPGNDKKFGKFDVRLIDHTNDMGLDFKDTNNLDDFIPIQLHIPKNKVVRFRLRSRDVIHSVFIPHLRVKMDAVPGIATSIHFIPRVSTKEMRTQLNDPDFNYEITCTELCGRMHFAMKMIVVIDEPDEYEKWYQSQKSWISLHPDYNKNN